MATTMQNAFTTGLQKIADGAKIQSESDPEKKDWTCGSCGQTLEKKVADESAPKCTKCGTVME